VAKSSPICPQGVVVQIKRKIVEGKEKKRGGRWLASHISLAWRPHMASTQLPLSFSPYLIPLMLTPLVISIKSKANSLHLFQSSIYFFKRLFRFYEMQAMKLARTTP
jgi:hypothetical protein